MTGPAVYFADAGQEVVVSAGQVRAGAPELAYVFVKTDTVKTGNSTYTGCQAYRETAISDVYTRPDATTYAEAKGAGTPEGPVDVCATTQISQEFNPSALGRADTLSNGQPDNCYFEWSAFVTKTQKKNLETGSVVSATCGWQSPSSQARQTIRVQSGCIGGWGPQGIETKVSISPCPF